MKEIRINDFTEFHEIIDDYDARTVIYRGMKSVDYPLIPKIGRIVPPDSVGSRQKNEQEILRLFKTELSGPEIARELVIALSTVRTHTKSIYSKLNVSNRRAAVKRAEELGLI